MRRDLLGVVLAAGGACAAVASFAHADIYKWVDERGTTIYSDRAPKDRGRIKDVFRSADLRPPSTPASAAAAASEQQSLELRLLSERVDRLTRAIEAERGARYATLEAPAPADINAAPSRDYWRYAQGYAVIGAPFGPGLRHFDRLGHFDRFRHFHKAAPGSFASRGGVAVRGGRAVRAGSGRTEMGMR